MAEAGEEATLQGLLVVVTPATGLVGRTVSRALSARGARVIGTGARQAALARLGAEVALAITMDPDDPLSLEIGGAAIRDRFGQVAALVYCPPNSSSDAPSEPGGDSAAAKILAALPMGAEAVSVVVAEGAGVGSPRSVDGSPAPGRWSAGVAGPGWPGGPVPVIPVWTAPVAGEASAADRIARAVIVGLEERPDDVVVDPRGWMARQRGGWA